MDRIDMTGNSSFRYLIILDHEGNVIFLRATNGTFAYGNANWGSPADGSDERPYVTVDNIDVNPDGSFEVESFMSGCVNTSEIPPE